MGYSRLFAILVNLKQPVRVKALATCCGMEEAKVGYILIQNQVDFGLTVDDKGFIHTEAMKKRLVVEYEGSESLEITLIECVTAKEEKQIWSVE